MGRRDQNNKTYPHKVCVICSTQNQMVNYIPLKMEKKFTFETIYNITVSGSTYFNNATWDTNLKATLNKTFDDISLQQGDTHSVAKILEHKQLESLKTLEGAICWNITGGQRTILLAIMKIIKSSDKRNNDVICYLEGNNNQMYISDIHHQKADVIDYSKEEFDLDITKALKLGGFEISKANGDEKHIDENSLKSFITEYDNTKNGLRDLMIKTNTKMTQEEAITELNKLSCQQKGEIQKVIEWGYTKNKSTPFGYILEEMTYYVIKKSEYFKNIQELKTNVRLYNDTKIDEVNNTQIDEFDVLLLTKNGKLMVFECKSGSMHPDIAKSTKYSTYAISGVYGLPILITPLLGSEISNLKALGEEYKYIKSAVISAKRASLEVWGIDEIEEHLKKYINLTGATK